MRTIETTVYKFDELSDAAKEKAREWFRRGIGYDQYWSECTIEDAQQCAEVLGIEFDTRHALRMDGKTNENPKIWFSGFSSQGDGACFEGRYTYKKGAAKAIREHAPQDTALHRIADELQAIQKTAFYRLSARCAHNDRYCHSGCMTVDVQNVDACGNDLGTTEAQERDLTQALRDFADWIYKQLETEWDYMNSDERIDESIQANEYEFDEDGRRAGR